MKLFVAILIILLVTSSCICFADEIIELEDGKTIQLNDDKTWQYVEPSLNQKNPDPKVKAESPVKNVKYAEDAVDIWDKSLELGEVSYSKSVKLYLHYKNNTEKKVVGISTHVSVINPFGQTVLDNTFNDETTLEPMERSRNDTFWHFDENPFIHNLPYNNLWQMAQNGSGKVLTHVVKVVFEDGTVLTRKSSSAKSNKKPTKKK
ncbi:MAG: DUF3157 family protein [Desulfuromonadaceae bacterium]|nr:DUF3157 family protein [Desulfuromonadaceae bacterium]